MAGKGDIVEQALKLIMGGGNDAAKKAFANTRLKTPQGDPMRLYHMTPEDIFEFRASPENRSGPAVFLSPYPDFQPAYHQSAERGPSGELTSQFKEGANVMPVYADVRNPLVLDHPRKIKEAAAKYQGGDRNFPRIVTPEARAAMEADGYDGVVFGGDSPIPYGDRAMDARLGFQEARDEEFLVFDPKRVKSAVSNTGEYDFTNPDITKTGGGEVSDDVDDALRIAKGNGGAFTKIVKSFFGPSEREGLEALTKAGSGYKGVPGKPVTVKLPGIGEVEAKPLPSLESAAEGYMKRLGRPGEHTIDVFPPLDEDFARRVAGAYGEMKHAPTDPEVKRTYDALAQETLDQLEAAKQAGIDFSFIRGEDPYKSSPGMGYADLAERGHLYVFPTEQGFGSDVAFDPVNNPLLKRIGPLGDLENATVNDAFRIVHDLYGHYGPGNPFFRAPGEERAFKLHSRMYSPEARPAMASETRGQNSWLNFGPYGSYNRGANAAETIYADQKTGIMPPWTYEKADGGVVDDALRIAKDVGGSADAPNEDMGRTYEMVSQLTPAKGPVKQPSVSTQWYNLPSEQKAELIAQYPDLEKEMEIERYHEMTAAKTAQPYETRAMTHDPSVPRSDMKINMPLFGGEYSLGSAPYNVAEGLQNMAQSAYDFKTMPFYFSGAAAPIALGIDVAESRLNDDPIGLALNAVLTPQTAAALKTAGRSALGFARRNPKATAAVMGAGSYLSPDSTEADPFVDEALELTRNY
jgi:hypothetical protein